MRTSVVTHDEEVPTVDLLYPVRGAPVPFDHAFALSEAIGNVLGGMRHLERWAIHPLRGRRVSQRKLALDGRSALAIRLPRLEVEAARKLDAATIDVAGIPVSVGAPTVVPLAPSPTLRAELVSLAGSFEDDKKAERALRRELERLELEQPLRSIDIRIGRRALMSVRDKTIVGFAAELHGLESAPSLTIQASGVGARRQMGAGLFVVPPRRR